MFLTEEQAAILISGRSFLTHLTISQVEDYIDKFKSASSGQMSILLDTGAKLYYSTDKFKFYVSGYREDECDTISLLDHLDLADTYFKLLLKREGFTPEKVERRKLVYQDYEESRLRKRQVA